MTDQTCRCGRPAHDAYVCQDCLSALARALGDIPWLDTELDTTIARQKGVDYRKLGGGKGGKKPTDMAAPANLGASDAKAELRALLVSWVRLCAEERVRHRASTDNLPTNNLPALSRWLMNRVDGLGLHEAGPDAVDEITVAVTRCHRIIDRPADKLYAGRCGANVNDVVCVNDLYATPGAQQIKCHVCASAWDTKERRDYLLKQAEEVLATAVEISRALSWLGAQPLTADRIRQWASRGRITAKGHDPKSRPMYRVGDVIDLIADSALTA